MNVEEDWAWLHGRGGFARYLSIFGDPNVGAMCGALLPLVVVVLRDIRHWSRLAWLVVSGAVYIWAAAVVAYSVSQTALILLVSSLVASWWVDRDNRRWQALQLGAIVAMSHFVFPDIIERISGILENAGASPPSFYLSGPGWLPQSSKLLRDLDFRLFAYLDLNDTPFKILFGSGYDMVVPSSYYNPLGILAHNGFKEIYLNGGLFGLGLYGLLFALTGARAVRIVRFVDLSPMFSRFIQVVAITYFELLFVMFVFPVYHYTGIGVVFWGSVGLIHALNLLVLSGASKRLVPA